MSYEMALKEHYASVRERLAPPPVVHVRRTPLPVYYEPEPKPIEVQARDPLRIFSVTDEGPAEAPPIPEVRSPSGIINDVARKHRVSFMEITGRQRSKEIVRARHEAFYRLKTETTFSLPQIGRRMGGFNHTSVMHGIAKHRERMAEAARGRMQ